MGDMDQGPTGSRRRDGARGLKPRELVQLATIARRYYLEDQDKKKIGEELGISRYKVSRILDRARALGIVQIDIKIPTSIDGSLSQRLAAAYGLRSAIVVVTPGEPEELLRAHLGEMAAQLLGEIIEPGDVLGVAWGRTLNAMTTALTSLPRCTVVQMTGAAGTAAITETSVELVRLIARVSGGRAFPIYAPLILDTTDSAAAIRRQPQVAAAMQMFGQLTKAVVAVGSWNPPNSQLLASLSGQELAALVGSGVRAEICATLLDDDGRVIPHEVTDRSISISTEDLRRVPEVIAVAGGESKAHAIRAVLLSGLVTTVVTDQAVARQLVDSAPHRLPNSERQFARRSSAEAGGEITAAIGRSGEAQAAQRDRATAGGETA